MLGILSIVADAIGSIENVAHARSHALLAAIMLLGVVSLGWDGIVRPLRRRYPRRRRTPRRTSLRGLTAREPHQSATARSRAADDVSLTLEPGTVTALVGPNGSGKTTVLRLLAGAVRPDAGAIEHGGVARTLQATAVFPTLTALEHLLAAAGRADVTAGFVRSLLATPKARAEDAGLAAAADAMLEQAGIAPDVPASELPVGEQRLLMVLTAAASGRDDAARRRAVRGSVAGGRRAGSPTLLAHLRDEGRAILVVEHNLGVVERIADRVIELDGGSIVETS